MVVVREYFNSRLARIIIKMVTKIWEMEVPGPQRCGYAVGILWVV